MSLGIQVPGWFVAVRLVVLALTAALIWLG
jgi:hypothetical protein